MAQKEGTIDLGKPGVTVSEYLFRIPYYKGRARVVGTQRWAVRSDPHDAKKWAEIHLPRHRDSPLRQPDSDVSGKISLVPEHQGLPKVSAEVLSGFAGSPEATVSIGLPSDLLSAKRHWTFGDTPTITSTVGSNLGPASLYYRTQEQPDSEADMRSQEFGGRLRAGPFSVGGSRMETSQEIMPEEQRSRFEDPRSRFWKDMGWLSGKANILGGVGSLNLQRTWSRDRQPWYESKHPPRTEAELSYERPLGPGTIGGTARGQMVRGSGQQYGADVSYRFPWLGGDASVGGGFTGRRLSTAQYPGDQTSGWDTFLKWTKTF